MPLPYLRSSEARDLTCKKEKRREEKKKIESKKRDVAISFTRRRERRFLGPTPLVSAALLPAGKLPSLNDFPADVI